MGFFRRCLSFCCCCCNENYYDGIFLNEPLLYHPNQDVYEVARLMTMYASGIPQRS